MGEEKGGGDQPFTLPSPLPSREGSEMEDHRRRGRREKVIKGGSH